MVFEINADFASFILAVKAFGGYGPVFYYDSGSARYVRAFAGGHLFVHEASTTEGTIVAAFPEAIELTANMARA